jgi:hypothetical protein
MSKLDDALSRITSWRFYVETEGGKELVPPHQVTSVQVVDDETDE